MAREVHMPPSAGTPQHELAGAHALRDVPLARPHETVGDVLGRIATSRHECADLICVTSVDGKLHGALRLADALAAARDARIGALATLQTVGAAFDADQESVAGLACDHGMEAMPVVDADGILQGVVPARALLAILRSEHVEDLHRLAGIQRETRRATEALEEPPTRRARHRLPWLLVGLLGSGVATAVVATFETVLRQRIAVAFFVPAIVYLADAVGTQTEAVAVRGLSLSRMPLRRMLWGELRTGLTIGATLGTCAFVAVAALLRDVPLAAAVGTALLCAGAGRTRPSALDPWRPWSRTC
jgi:magnesium transporter